MNKILSITLIISMVLPGVAFGQFGLELSSDTISKGFKGDDIIKVVEALSKSVYVKTQIPHKRID